MHNIQQLNHWEITSECKNDWGSWNVNKLWQVDGKDWVDHTSRYVHERSWSGMFGGKFWWITKVDDELQIGNEVGTTP